jgi:hypothetical protein
MHRAGRFAALLIVSAQFLGACASVQTAWKPSVQHLLAIPATQPSGMNTVWSGPEIPADVSAAALNAFGLTASSDPHAADCRLRPGTMDQVGAWIYALVAPFNTVTDDVATDAFVAKWQNHGGEFPAREILVGESDLAFLSARLGTPDHDAVKTLPQGDIAAYAWGHPDAWAVIPFDQLQPLWKVLAIGGINPVEKQFEASRYALTFPLSMECAHGAVVGRGVPQITNRDPGLLTTVILTGTTALVRGTAAYMETKGLRYPDSDIRDVLREADFLHVSNEVAYSPDCPLPWLNPDADRLRFCSAPKYNELLQDIGTDIVELTGDHLRDWGPEAITYTLDLYRSLGWHHYGGGYNLEDGRKALQIEHNGNRLAFLGCNAKPPGYATASPTAPGAVHCDFEDLTARIEAVKAAGYIPIVTFQDAEYDSDTIIPELQAHFRQAADAGAQIVSGSQGHRPKAIEFYKGAFLHYGLGNLFFDQYDEGLPNREAFIDRYVFYNGKYISTQLLTTMFTDLAHPRWMTAGERQDLLTTIFGVSVWQ